MTDLLKEVKDELQQEKLHLAVRKYYKATLALIIAIIISTSLYVYLREKNINEQEDLSKEYYRLFMTPNKRGPIREGDFGKLVDFNKSIYSKFAKMQYVNSLVQAKEYSKAVELLLNIISVSKKEPEIANISRLRIAGLVMKHKLSAYNDKTIDELQKATRKNDVPYFYMMKLLLGEMIIETGKQEAGLNILRNLVSDDKTPNNIKFFSNAILENYLN
jgi:predicted negative regulator of RcsB-dependent stress response